MAISLRSELDDLISLTEEYDRSKIPTSILSNLEKWRWGSYGWVSPASLLFTAAWRKYYYPNIDCCKIWAADENNKPIPGGYSIRSEDESISIPLLAKYDLCNGFCSPNSGMQGSRAIEKMRSLRRLNTDFDNAQRTLFDLKLFAAILNQTNDLEHDQLLELIKYYIVTAKTIKARRLKVNEGLMKETAKSFSPLSALSSIADPEFTKCVTAACLTVLYKSNTFAVTGVEDFKTAADARAQKPGDLTVERSAKPVLAIEVKDKTQHIDWQNIERASRILTANPDLQGFVFVLESRDAATTKLINEMVNSSQLKSAIGSKISIMSLFSLYQLAKAASSDAELINQTSRYLALAPAVKPGTKDFWLKAIQ